MPAKAQSTKGASIRTLLVLTIGLLSANLVAGIFLISDETIASEPLVSSQGSCRLPAAMTRSSLDQLAAKVIERINEGDDQGVLELHSFRPEYASDDVKKRHEASIKMGVKMAQGMGRLGDITPDSYQNFQFIGEWKSQEVFLINYAVDAEPKREAKYLPNTAVLRLQMVWDGAKYGLSKVEVRYMPVKKP